MTLDTPEGRLRYIEAHGHEAYNRAMKEQFARNTIKSVNGYPLRYVSTPFGRLVAVDGTRTAFRTLAEAEAFAMKQSKKATGE